MRMFLFCILACISISLRASSDSEFNEFLKDCQIQRFCGSGSFGDVYEVHHKTLGRIALKSINCGDDEQEFQTAKKEARLRRELEHDNIVRHRESFFLKSEWNTLIARRESRILDMNFEDLALLPTPMNYACLCFEFMDADLDHVIRHNYLSRKSPTIDHETNSLSP